MIKIECLIFIGALIILGIIGIVVTKMSLKKDSEQFEKQFKESEEEE